MTDLKALSQKVSIALTAGHAAAEAEPNDGGSANLDHVVLIGLKGVRRDAMIKAGIHCYKRGPGQFALSHDFGGQGMRRAAGVEAMARTLSAEGVDCYINYITD